jgi:NADH-quinone oxidoreductase subunit E
MEVDMETLNIEQLEALMQQHTSKIAQIVDNYVGKEEHIISLLQDVQAKYNYLPRNVLVYISDRLDMPLSRLFSIATFFRAFSLKPKGRHTITVCTGTACHVKGAQKLIDKMGRDYQVKPGHTSADKRFSLEKVNCLGCCAIGPVAVVDGKYEGKLNSDKFDEVLSEQK